MKTSSSHLSAPRSDAFSLVEVTIAIGIFAFVVVGIMGLLPAGMRMRADSAAETRGLLIAEELFASVRASSSVRAVVLRDGPSMTISNLIRPPADLLAGPLVVGYPSGTTMPYGVWHSSRANDPEAVWRTGSLPAWAVANAIDTLARIEATTNGVPPGLAQITIQVRGPASIPLANSRPVTFSTLLPAQ